MMKMIELKDTFAGKCLAVLMSLSLAFFCPGAIAFASDADVTLKSDVGGLTETATYSVNYTWEGLPSAQTLFDENGIGLEGDNKPKPPAPITDLVSGVSYTVDSSQPGMVVYTQDGPGNKTAKYTLGDWKNSAGESVSGQQTMGDSDVTLKATWTKEKLTVQTWDVTYRWNLVADEGVTLPEGATLPGTETLPSTFKIANNDTLEYCGNADKKYTAGYTVITDADADYGYVFSGWDITTGCILENTAITGTWTYGPIKHKATYQWKWVGLPDGVQIEDVQLYDKDGNPIDTPTPPAPVEGLVKGQVLNLDTTWTFKTVYTHDEYDNIIGMYSLERWQQSDRDSDTYAMPGEDVVLTTNWMAGPVAPVPTNLVQYDWGWENVPNGANFPWDNNSYKKGQSYTVLAAPANVEDRDESGNLIGTYVFSGWKNEAGEIVSGQQQIMGETSPWLTGTWTYVKPFALAVSGQNQEPIETYNYKAEKDLGYVAITNSSGSASDAAVKMDCVIDREDAITRVQLGLPKEDSTDAVIANINSISWMYEDDSALHTWTKGDAGSVPWTEVGLGNNCVIMSAPTGKTFASISITVAKWNASDATASTCFYGTQDVQNRSDFSKHTVTLFEADEEDNFTKSLGSATAGGKVKQQTSMDVTPSAAGSEANAGSTGNIDIKLYATQKSGDVYSKGCVALILPNGITPTSAQQYYDLNEWGLSIAPTATLRESHPATQGEITASGIKDDMDAAGLTEATVWIYDLDQNATSARTSSESSIHLKVNYTVDSLMPAFSAPFSSLVYAGTNLSGVTSSGTNVIDDPFDFASNGKVWSCTTGTTLTISSPAQVSVSNAVKKADGTYVTYDPNNENGTTAVLGGDVTGNYKVTVTDTVDKTGVTNPDNYIYIPLPKTGVRIAGKSAGGGIVDLLCAAGFNVALAGKPSVDSEPFDSIEYRYCTMDGYRLIAAGNVTDWFNGGSATASEDTNLIAVKVSGQTKGSQFTITVPFTTPAYEQLETVYTQFQAISVYVSTGSSYASYTASDGTGTIMLGFTNTVRNITFNLEGGTSAGGTDPTTVSDGRMATEPSAPTKDKCDFAGWYTSEADAAAAVAANAFDFANTPITADTMFYAGWKAGTYNLTYDLDGGVAPTTANPTTYTYGVGIDGFNAPTKVGNTFLGWYDAAGYNAVGEPLGKRVATIPTDDWGNKTLYAKWSVNSYALNFDTQLGTSEGTPSFEQQVKFGGHPVTIGDPIREGYVFAGWFDNAEGTGAAVVLADYVMPAGTPTLYAKWNAAAYEIIFKPAPTSSGISFTGADMQTGVAYGSNLDNTITMTGPNADYSFGGWSYSYLNFRGDYQSGTLAYLNDHKGMEVKGNITFTPIVTNNSAYSLSADTGGTASAIVTADGTPTRLLSGVTAAQEVTFSNSVDDYRYANEITMISTASASGAHYKLSGATVSDSYGHKMTLSSAASGTFKAGPTTNVDVSYAYKINGELSLTINAPGYFFTKDLEGIVSLNVDYAFTEDAKADVRFKGFDGENIQTNPGKYAGDMVGDAPAAPAKDHYTFKEWNTKADGTGTAWSATLAVTDVQAAARSIDFYPIYSPTPFDITYDLAGGTAATNPATYNVETDGFILSNPTKTGYVFAGWTGTGLASATTNVTVARGSFGNRAYTATWSPANDTAYKVEHYLQNLDDSYPATPANADDKIGTTGEGTNAAAKTYEGFTAGAVTQSAIAADGSTVVRIEYARNGYNLSFDSQGGSAIADAMVKFGASVSKPGDPTRLGYAFAGWYADSACSAGNEVSFDGLTMPATATTCFAKWTESANVTITYAAGEHGSVSPASESVAPATGKAKGSIATASVGYDFANWTNDVNSTVITDPALTAAQVDAVAKASGIYEPAAFTANFTAKSGIAYKVEHYQQALDGSYPADPTETDNMTGTTDEQTAAAAKAYTGFTAGTVMQTAIAGDGSTVVRIEYARNTDAAYTVHYALQVDETTTQPLQADKQVTGATFGKPYEETAPAIAGYKVDVATKQVTAGYDNNEITFTYTADFSAIAVAGFAITYDGQAHAVQVTGTLSTDTVELYAGSAKLAANSFMHVADSQAAVTVKVTRNGVSWQSGPVAATLAKRALSWDASGLSAAKKQDGSDAIPVAGTLKVSGEAATGDAGFAYGTLTGRLIGSNAEGTRPAKVTAASVSVTGDYELPTGDIVIEGIVSAPDAEYSAPDQVADGDTTTIFRLIANEGAPATPEALTGDERYDTPAKIEAALQLHATAQLAASSTVSFAVMDVKLLTSTDKGITWVVATEQNMPAGGVTVLIPYPEGTNGDDYDFTVSHLVSSGAAAGTIESVRFEKTPAGLRCTFHSLSPVAVGYAKAPVAPGDNTAGNDVTSGNAPAATAPAPRKLAATGDPMALAALALGGLASLALACCGVAIRRKRLR